MSGNWGRKAGWNWSYGSNGGGRSSGSGHGSGHTGSAYPAVDGPGQGYGGADLVQT